MHFLLHLLALLTNKEIKRVRVQVLSEEREGDDSSNDFITTPL